MTNNFIFIEDGSVDTNNMLKLLQNSGMTDANVIRYKQGTTKPELVSIESDDELVNATERRTIKNVLDILDKFIAEKTETSTLAEWSADIFADRITHRTVYVDHDDSFTDSFAKFLERHYKGD